MFVSFPHISTQRLIGTLNGQGWIIYSLQNQSYCPKEPMRCSVPHSSIVPGDFTGYWTLRRKWSSGESQSLCYNKNKWCSHVPFDSTDSQTPTLCEFSIMCSLHVSISPHNSRLRSLCPPLTSIYDIIVKVILSITHGNHALHNLLALLTSHGFFFSRIENKISNVIEESWVSILPTHLQKTCWTVIFTPGYHDRRIVFNIYFEPCLSFDLNFITPTFEIYPQVMQFWIHIWKANNMIQHTGSESKNTFNQI